MGLRTEIRRDAIRESEMESLAGHGRKPRKTAGAGKRGKTLEVRTAGDMARAELNRRGYARITYHPGIFARIAANVLAAVATVTIAIAAAVLFGSAIVLTFPYVTGVAIVFAPCLLSAVALIAWACKLRRSAK